MVYIALKYTYESGIEVASMQIWGDSSLWCDMHHYLQY